MKERVWMFISYSFLPARTSSSKAGFQKAVDPEKMALAEIIEFFAVLMKSIFAVFVSMFHCLIPEPLKSVRDKVILITGAGGGLGRLLSQKLALLGAKVILVDIDEVSKNVILIKCHWLQNIFFHSKYLI